jgi:hypothetical protein
MFCSKCGKELANDASFCSQCGQQIIKDAEATTVSISRSEAASQNSPTTQKGLLNQMREQLEKVKERKADYKEKLHSSPRIAAEMVKYLGGHPDASKAIDGVIQINKTGIFFEAAFTTQFYIPVESIIKAELKTQEQISKDVTLTRLLAFGIFAFALKKKTKNETSYLTVSYTENGIENAVIFDGNKVSNLVSAIAKIRQDYAKNNPSGVQLATQSSANNSSSNDVPFQIKRLAELKESGILTEEEFQQKKTDLLAKM